MYIYISRFTKSYKHVAHIWRHFSCFKERQMGWDALKEVYFARPPSAVSLSFCSAISVNINRQDYYRQVILKVMSGTKWMGHCHDKLVGHWCGKMVGTLKGQTGGTLLGQMCGTLIRQMDGTLTGQMGGTLVWQNVWDIHRINGWDIVIIWCPLDLMCWRPCWFAHNHKYHRICETR